MSSYKELKEEFNRKVKELQERCNHPVSEWMEEWWAIGHSSGCKVKVCKICNKELNRKTYIVDYEKIKQIPIEK